MASRGQGRGRERERERETSTAGRERQGWQGDMADKSLWCAHVLDGEERLKDGGVSTGASVEQVRREREREGEGVCTCVCVKVTIN